MYGGYITLGFAAISVVFACGGSTVSNGGPDGDIVVSIDGDPQTVDAPTSPLTCGAGEWVATIEMSSFTSPEATPTYVSGHTVSSGLGGFPMVQEMPPGTYSACMPNQASSLYFRKDNYVTTTIVPKNDPEFGPQRSVAFQVAEMETLQQEIRPLVSGHLLVEVREFSGSTEILGPGATGAVVNAGTNPSFIRLPSGSWISGNTTNTDRPYVLFPDLTATNSFSLTPPNGLVCQRNTGTYSTSQAEPPINHWTYYCVKE